MQLANPNYATYGTAAASVTLPGTDPRLAADIAAVTGRWGPADLIENQALANGTTQPVQLRAESPHGHYTSPLLGLVSGSYPAGPGQVALTSQVAALYGAHTGGTWQAAGATWRVTGIVQDPSNLADEFALVAPGQVTHPSQVTLLLGSSPAVQQAIGNGSTTLPRLPAAATFTFPATFMSGLPSATIALVVELLGLVFIGLMSVAGFSVMAQRRLRTLGMLSAIGATERSLRLVMITGRPGGLRGRPRWPEGRRARCLVRLRADAATGCRACGRCGEPALVGVRHRCRARDRDTGSGVPPSGCDDRPGASGDRAVWPPGAAEGGAPLRPARRHRVRGRRCVPGDLRRAGRGRRPRACVPPIGAGPGGPAWPVWSSASSCLPRWRSAC